MLPAGVLFLEGEDSKGGVGCRVKGVGGNVSTGEVLVCWWVARGGKGEGINTMVDIREVNFSKIS